LLAGAGVGEAGATSDIFLLPPFLPLAAAAGAETGAVATASAGRYEYMFER